MYLHTIYNNLYRGSVGSNYVYYFLLGYKSNKPIPDVPEEYNKLIKDAALIRWESYLSVFSSRKNNII